MDLREIEVLGEEVKEVKRNLTLNELGRGSPKLESQVILL